MLATESLAQLCQLDEAYTFEMIMPTLIKNSIVQAFHLRHGSLLALAALLQKWATKQPAVEQLNGVLGEVAQAILKVHKKKLVRGSGAEAQVQGLCGVVRCCLVLFGVVWWLCSACGVQCE